MYLLGCSERYRTLWGHRWLRTVVYCKGKAGILTLKKLKLNKVAGYSLRPPQLQDSLSLSLRFAQLHVHSASASLILSLTLRVFARYHTQLQGNGERKPALRRAGRLKR
jgi:hypothetical protein